MTLDRRNLLHTFLKHLFNILTPKQRSFIKRFLSPGQVSLINKLLDFEPKDGKVKTISPVHEKRQESAKHKDGTTSGKPVASRLDLYEEGSVLPLATRLWELGFVDRALQEFQSLLTDNSKPHLQKLAAWELSLWYADMYNEKSALKCLELLPIALHNEKNPVRLRRAAVLEIESLALLRETDAAKLAVSRILAKGPDADLFLAAANLEISMANKISWINKALELHGISSISLDSNVGPHAFLGLKSSGDTRKQAQMSNNSPKVTVIMPAYNAEATIQNALDSIVFQTWNNLEVLVVDDCSNDHTVAIIEKYVQKDSRVKLIKSEQNRGTYFTRNLGLKAAKGDLVTCLDADDWAHPERIEKQVLHLMENPSIVGNASQLTRNTPALKFYRRGNAGFYIQVNLASFMFRRELVLSSIGYWDSLRIGADAEFIQRAKMFFGKESVAYLKTGLLTFAMQTDVSLTGHKAFGYHGRKMGITKEYMESYTHFHAITKNLRFEFPQETRPFPVPEPMWPIREVKYSERRHFDVILASDFRFSGGTVQSCMEEIKQQRQMGLRTGLIQMSRYDMNPSSPIHSGIRELVDGNKVQMLVYGEELSCSLLALRYPPILQTRQRYIPVVKPDHVIVIMNQTPVRDYGLPESRVYDIKQCAYNLKEYFGKDGIWYPIGPQVREALHKHHKEDLTEILLANEDWTNIIDINQWRRASRPPQGPKIRIGRHSRDQYVKWPPNRDELLSIYPYSDRYEIHVLGGAEAPRKILGQLPDNWNVLQFNEIPPKDFLSTLDVFVFFGHPDCTEAFGRVIVEAMAVGVPTIIPYCYQSTFREAALYAQTAEVRAIIDRLMNDNDFYEAQVEKALRFVENEFGYNKHASRLNKFIEQNKFSDDK